MHPLPSFSFKTDNSSYVIAFVLGRPFKQSPFISPGVADLKVFIKNGHKIIVEVFGNTPAIVAAIADDLAFFRNDFYHGTPIKSIQHDVGGFTFGKGEAKMSCPLCW